MTSAIVLYVYAETVVQLLMDLGAAYFAVKLARVTGAFRGWVLMIVAVVLITLQSTSSFLSLILFYPEATLESLINSVGNVAVVEGSVFGIGTSLALLLAMFELFRTFRRLQKERPSPG